MILYICKKLPKEQVIKTCSFFDAERGEMKQKDNYTVDIIKLTKGGFNYKRQEF